MSPGPHRVLIVDDHPIVREGLRALISQHPDLAVCGEAESVSEALALAASAAPDIAVVDISLKDSDGLELIRCLRESYPSVRILVSSMHDESLYARRSLRAGALGFVSKENAAKQIVDAIRRVLEGRIYLSQEMSEQLISRMITREDDPSRSSVESLSDRELEVFRWIGHGLTTREIAGRLNLSIKTVETYRQRIRQKLELRNGAELARRATQWVFEEA
jgi:DNA-binding NarL/FixJ family response regulator